MKKGRSSTLVNQNSSSSSSLTNGKLKQLQGQQDEANLKLLRELSHIPSNKYCFDCGQRGPNYVNVTIGSFICMTCSGLLRGLTPPHRVKSISMASFTPEELELMKTHGNEYCRKVWLATCSSKDSKLGADNDPERLNNIKAFMSAKYEQKRFYLDPSRLPRGEIEHIQQETNRSLQQQQHNNNHSQKSPSLSSSTHSSDHSPTLNNFRQNNSQTHHRMVNSITLPDIKPLSSLLGSSPSFSSDLASLNGNGISLSSSSATKSNNSTPINFINNLAPLTNGNHSSTVSWDGSSKNSEASNNDFITNFADFDDAFNNMPTNNTSSVNYNNSFMNGNNDIFTTQTVPIPNQKVMNSNGPFNGMQTPLVAVSGHSPNISSLSNHNNNQNGLNNNFKIHNTISPSNANNSASLSSGDKYAALKDLDSLFNQPTADGDNDSQGVNGTSLSSLPNSTSLPANLSTSGNTNETGWFSTSPNPNPFSQAPASTQSNGWTNSASSNPNPHNPFYNVNPNGWQSCASTPMSNGPVFQPMPPNQGTLTMGMNGVGTFPSQHQFDKAFNPFFAVPKSNPNNPFL